jgi:hypothetical protein
MLIMIEIVYGMLLSQIPVQQMGDLYEVSPHCILASLHWDEMIEIDYM